MGSMDEETVTILDDIRKELRIANQLKFLELTHKAYSRAFAPEMGSLVELSSFKMFEDLRDKLVPSDDTIKQ
jgi:hypothetical protein